MKICLYGAGAIGGLMGVRLANKGAEVSVVEVGAPLAAIKANGLKVQSGGEMFSAQVKASSEPAELGVQDLIIVAVKGPTFKFVAQKIGALIGPDTIIMTAMNGVPWWFFEGFGGKFAGTQLKSVDPDGSIGKGHSRRSRGRLRHQPFVQPGRDRRGESRQRQFAHSRRAQQHHHRSRQQTLRNADRRGLRCQRDPLDPEGYLVQALRQYDAQPHLGHHRRHNRRHHRRSADRRFLRQDHE